MIIDTSAVIAILKNEPESDAFSEAIEAAKVVRISAASYLESNIVIGRCKNPILTARLEEILENPGLQVEPVTAAQAKIAWKTYRAEAVLVSPPHPHPFGTNLRPGFPSAGRTASPSITLELFESDRSFPDEERPQVHRLCCAPLRMTVLERDCLRA